MTKLTPRDVSPAEFETWSQAPWFRKYLALLIEDAKEATRDCAAQVLVTPLNSIDPLRLSAAGYGGYVGAYEDLRDLTYEDLVEVDDEEQS